MQNIVVVNKPQNWDFQIPDVEVVSAKAYVTNSQYAEIRNARVYNLCQSYRYQSMGYYVSLLAEARGHRSFPNITTIQDLKSQSIIRIISDEVDQLIQRSLMRLRSSKFDLNIYFGRSVAKQYEQLSKHLYNLFPAPLLHVCFTWHDEQKKWMLQNIFPLPLNQIPDSHKPYLLEFAREYFSRKRIRSSSSNNKIFYELAILTNPDEKAPPSDKRAIAKFIDAAEDNGMRARLITKNDYSRIPEFDGLFIRETTCVNHHTYRFARRADAENLVVIDDPISIVRCANKVYMAEMFKKANIPTPKTIIIHKKNQEELLNNTLSFPYVLKQPDSSFSRGVVKVSDQKELDDQLERLLNQSDLIIAQEFVPTEFDWRIGILDKKPLYACRYHMAKNHWQILKWRKSGINYGKYDSVPLSEVPEKVLKVAQRAANLVGDGFYGVDLKEMGKQVMLMEVNDNPNIDVNVEDGILKDELYAKVMRCMLERIRKRKE